jgi:hypothetical protein
MIKGYGDNTETKHSLKEDWIERTKDYWEKYKLKIPCPLYLCGLDPHVGEKEIEQWEEYLEGVSK